MGRERCEVGLRGASEGWVGSGCDDVTVSAGLTFRRRSEGRWCSIGFERSKVQGRDLRDPRPGSGPLE